MERQKYNKLILETLSKLIEKYPDLRFGQLLIDCDILQLRYSPDSEETYIEDCFNEEPSEMWKRMCNNPLCFKKNETN